MKKYNVIFCVLTYKNYTDLLEFIDSLKINQNVNFTYKIIVVNNFADIESLNEIRNIALSNDCDFIENENKGYSHGNNLGIEYARSNYDFDYIVACNPDIIIKQFDINNIKQLDKCIIAPEIICLNNKRQNPLYFRYLPISEKIVYHGFHARNKFLVLCGILINKIDRCISRIPMKCLKKSQQEIYACHGSCIIFSKYSIERLSPVFDSNIFLFCEESDLAQKARKNGIDILYRNDIVVNHKEDGSMKLSNNNLYEIHRQSYLYYYKKWNSL